MAQNLTRKYSDWGSGLRSAGTYILVAVQIGDCVYILCLSIPLLARNQCGRSSCMERMSFSPERLNNFREADDRFITLTRGTEESNEKVDISGLA